MAYYRRYRTWRSRGFDAKPSKYSVLERLFGSAVKEIRAEFEKLDPEALDELFNDYGSVHGNSAEKYARKTFSNWKSGKTKLSGQTMERLIELVPPYLKPEVRMSLLRVVVSLHKKSGTFRSIRINIDDPEQGFRELSETLSQMRKEDPLAHLPENVMKAASWLYDDDITAARSMLAEAERLENESLRSSAERELELLKRTVKAGQVRSASYSVQMPAGSLSVTIFSPSVFQKAFRIAGKLFGN